MITSDSTGVSNAYFIDIATGNTVALTQSTDQPIDAVSWFAQDDRILYSSDRHGNEQHHVFVRDRNGTATDLTPGEAVKAFFLGWSRDGQWFFLATNERDAAAFDLYRYAARDYSRKLVFRNELKLEINAIHPDGTYAAGVQQQSAKASEIYVIDLTEPAGRLTRVASDAGPAWQVVLGFSPTSAARILYSTNVHGEYAQVWSYDFETRERHRIAAGEWDVSGAVFSPSGRYRLSATNEDGRTRLSIHESDRGSSLRLPEQLTTRNVHAVSLSRDEATMAFAIDGPDSPPNIHLFDVRTGSVRRLTDALGSKLDERVLVNAQVVRYPSFDGLRIPAVLYRPNGATPENRAPAVVFVHGGPGGQSRLEYSPTTQHLVNHGYAVLEVNNRGSSGYGKTFHHMDDRRHGEDDLQDVVSGGAYLRSLPWIDAQRIAVMGRSYGGYLALAAMAFEPEAFAAAIDVFGVTNWEGTLKDIPPWWGAIREELYDEMGDPAKDAQRLRRISPFLHAKNIRRPILVVQGANDPRVKAAETEEFVAVVRAAGASVDYVKFPDEGHGFRKRANRIEASERYLDFLEKHLGSVDSRPAARARLGD